MKVVLQNSNQDCLLACYSMILSAHGNFVPLYDLYEEDMIPPDGLSVRHLKKLNEKFQLSMRVLKGTTLQLTQTFNKTLLPIIVQWDGNHFVVVEKFMSKKIKIIDPNFGKLTISYDEFDNHFSGYVIRLNEKENFIKKKVKSAFSQYFPKIFKGKNTVGYILALLVSQVTSVGFSIVISQILKPSSNFLSVLAFITVLCVGRFIGFFLEKKSQTETNLKFEKTISSHLFNGLFSRPLLYFRNNTIGTVIEKINLRISIRDTILFSIVPSIINFLSMLVLFIYLATISAILALTTVFLVIIFLISNIAIFKKRLDANSLYVQQLINNSSLMQSDLSQIEKIKAQNLEEYKSNIWSNSSYQLQTSYNSILSLNSFSSFFSQTFTFITLTILMLVGVYLVNQQIISITDLLLFQTAATMFIGSVTQVQSSVFQLGNLSVYADKLSELLIENKRHEDQYLQSNSKIAIAVENLSYTYTNSSQKLFEHGNFKIIKGEKIAVLGNSGTGKSTLILILLGLISSDGQVYYGIKNFRKYLGIVLQNMSLSKGTVLENLVKNTHGLTVETVNEINKVLSDVNALDIVNNLPRKINSQLFEQGKNLSGGQVQRMLMAQSLLNDSKLIIWDESFSSLDNYNRQYIYENVLKNEDYANKTMIIISHHIDIRNFVDKIIFINEITHEIEYGRHSELYVKSENYRHFIGENQ